MIIAYFLVLSIILVAIGLAGIATDRHLIIIMLAIELIFLASTIALIAFFSYNPNPDPIGIVALICIWAVAAVEIIVVITFYVFIKSEGYDFDVSKLSKLKW